MNLIHATLFATLGALATLTWNSTREPATPGAQDDKSAVPFTADDMAEMKKKIARYTKPGEHHKVLERFLGKWDVESRFFMGADATPPEKGTMEFSWLMNGRWIQARGSGAFMHQNFEQFHVMGYDNFKMSFVSTSVSSIDTAMTRLEGDMTPDGKSLVMYGTLDEYTTGEHDKMVKYAWRFLSADKLVLEVHDLPIGEVNTKVVEFTFTRAK